VDAARLANAARFFTAANSRSIESMLEAFAENCRYHGTERHEGESTFHRKWMEGREELRAYLGPWLENAESVEYVPTRIVADSTTVSIEWTTEVHYPDANGNPVEYRNIGISNFEFEDGSDLIATARTYFDWDAMTKSLETGVSIAGSWAPDSSAEA
jgi:ketosteroid isomerase-like protein